MSVAHTRRAEPPVSSGTVYTAPPRVLGDLGDPAAGPTLVVVGGLHGNEPAGLEAAHRILQRLTADGAELPGRLLAVVGNRAALAAGVRFHEADLNRVWLPDRLAAVRGEENLEAEEREMVELDAVLRPVLAAALGTPYVLDIHTTSGPGPAFSVLHDTLANRRFARTFPVPIVLGLEEELPGTLMDYLTEHGAVALSVESGQHEDPASADRAEAMIWIAMELAGVLPSAYATEVGRARALLASDVDGLPCAVEVRHRHPIPAGADFKARPGFRSFQPVAAGKIVADQDGRPVPVPLGGLLLMPLYQRLGEDGFFVTRRVREVWLNLSTWLRRRRLERFLHWLPGVTRVPAEAISFRVDRRVARWLAPEIFHLLGFRRRELSGRHVLMERRVDRPRAASSAPV